jgi:heme/copper-type cytochrome/quinol oxidase subunit 2
MKPNLKNHYLWVVFLIGMFLLNYPVLSIYNIPQLWFGIPVLYFMVFGIWLLLIGITFLIIRKTNKEKDA